MTSVQHDLTRTHVDSLLYQRFQAVALERPGVAMLASWADVPLGGVAEAFLAGGDWSVARVHLGGFQAWLADDGEVTLYFHVDAYGGWQAAVSAGDQAAADALLAEVVDRLPAAPERFEEDGVLVRFWTLGPLGPNSYLRRVAVAPWVDVAGNYPAGVRAGLERLMTMGPPSAGGRLALLHGPPGTGKTHALRALAQELAPWADVDYVIDVDAFFSTASYMVSTMVMEETVVPISEDGAEVPERWRVVVLEDSGEYLRGDATDKVGLGLGRLLNLADGLVGQGLRIILLMTTNEPVTELHPAVTRPGRCMANLEMGPFPPEEAAAWLAARGQAVSVDQPMTLAELYARLSGEQRGQRAAAVDYAVSRAVPVQPGLRLLRWTATPQEDRDVPA